jgi:hypothetical protein
MANVPFNLPEEISEIIFDYLHSKDLLNCLLVSTIWNDFILHSKCFNKVALLADDKLELESVTRSYKHVKIYKLKDKKLFECLNQFCDTVKRLELNDCTAEDIKPIKFSNLQELTLFKVTSPVLQSFLNFHENLKVLNLQSIKLSVETLISFLKLNKNLKEINLYLYESWNLFDDDIAHNFHFNLESVTISFRSNYEIDSRTLKHIERFLISQGRTLKTVGLINSASLSSVYRVWNFLTVVEKFYFFSADAFFDFDSIRPEPEIKKNLEALEVHVLGPTQLYLDDFKSLLTSSTNLKSFGVWNLNKEIVELAANSLTNLQNIFCATMENGCEDFYDELKAKSEVNAKIKLHQYL